MSALDLSKADNKDAKLTLKLRAKSGYSSDETHIISANQWAEILLIIADAEGRRKMSAAPELLEALETAMQRVKAWDVDFVMDDEWPADEAIIKAALAKARGDDALARATEALNDETNEMVALSKGRLA